MPEIFQNNTLNQKTWKKSNISLMETFVSINDFIFSRLYLIHFDFYPFQFIQLEACRLYLKQTIKQLHSKDTLTLLWMTKSHGMNLLCWWILSLQLLMILRNLSWPCWTHWKIWKWNFCTRRKTEIVNWSISKILIFNILSLRKTKTSSKA